jgi:hypothetical protein
MSDLLVQLREAWAQPSDQRGQALQDVLDGHGDEELWRLVVAVDVASVAAMPPAGIIPTDDQLAEQEFLAEAAEAAMRQHAAEKESLRKRRERWRKAWKRISEDVNAREAEQVRESRAHPVN